MNRKKRKSLDDSLASKFVFGSDCEASRRHRSSETASPDIESKSELLSKGKPEEIVTAESESTSITSMSEKPAKKSNKESSLMQKLQLEAKEPTKSFTIDLRGSVHRKLSILAAKTGRTKADIVRMLLDDALENINE